jgi:AcrR family transcriptional regulator
MNCNDGNIGRVDKEFQYWYKLSDAHLEKGEERLSLKRKMQGKREKSSRKKKERIINITLRLLLKKGGAASTSTTDICAAARITRPTLYHYFGSKRNLLLAAHMASIERELRPFMEEAAAMADPMERLKYMVLAFLRKIICLHPELRVLIHDTLTVKDKRFKEVREEWRKHYTLLRDTIEALQVQGKADDGLKPSWAALFVLGMLTWTTYWYNFDRKESIEDLSETALQMVLTGLGGTWDSAGPVL